MSPTVSVLIPAYNREQYVEAAARSVLTQTFTDLEVIIINDASTDTTADIAEKLAAEDSRVKVLHHTNNKRRSGALNTGIEHATGTYISILDSDDYYVPSKLERQVAFLQEHPGVDVVYGDFEILPMDKTETREVSAINSLDGAFERMHAKARGEDISIMTGGYIPACSPLFRREVFASLRFDESMRNMEDLDMWLQIIGAGFVFKRLPGSTYVYRHHPDQKGRDSERAIAARAYIEEKLLSGAYLQETQS